MKRNEERKGYTLNQNGEYEGVVYLYRLKEGFDVVMSGWIYIGETARESARKGCFNCDGYSYGGRKFSEIRRRFGKDAFEYEVLFRIYDKDLDRLKERLEEIEAQLISDNDSYEHGFNSNKGGRGMSGIRQSESAKKKISQALKGRPKSETARKHMIEAAEKRKNNRNNPN